MTGKRSAPEAPLYEADAFSAERKTCCDPPTDIQREACFVAISNKFSQSPTVDDDRSQKAIRRRRTGKTGAVAG